LDLFVVPQPRENIVSEDKSRRSFNPPPESSDWTYAIPILALFAIAGAAYVWVWPVMLEFLQYCVRELHDMSLNP
jgi:hypothetical protein